MHRSEQGSGINDGVGKKLLRRCLLTVYIMEGVEYVHRAAREHQKNDHRDNYVQARNSFKYPRLFMRRLPRLKYEG